MIKIPTKEYKRQIKPNESELRHLEKSTGWLSTIARNRINSFSTKLPEDWKKGFKSRFTNDFGATYFELIIHQIFFHQGQKLAEHPDVLGSSRKPDYLIESNKEKIFLECKEFRNLTDDEKKLLKVKNEILYQLSILKSKSFLYNIEEFSVIHENVGNLQSEYSKIQAIMLQSPPKTIKDEYAYIHAHYQLINDKIRLRMNFSLRHDWEEEIIEDELLGTHMGNTILGFSEKSLRNGLIKKMTRYGVTNLPLVVSLNVASHWYCKRLIFESMFYGSTWMAPQTGKEGRDKNGIFTKPGNNLNHVAGALIFFATNPYGIEQAEYYYFKNPNYTGQISIMNDFTSVEFKNNQVFVHQNKSLKELVGE